MVLFFSSRTGLSTTGGVEGWIQMRGGHGVSLGVGPTARLVLAA